MTYSLGSRYKMMNVASYRLCTKCEQVKPRTPEFFPNNRRMSDGMSSWCRDCHRLATRARQQANPERNRERARAWGQAHPDRAGRKAAEWRRQNPERKADADRQWQVKNRDRKRATDRNWRANNLERARLNARLREARRRERKRKAAGSATKDQVLARITYYGWRCWVCRGSFDHIDHVLPLALGGSGWPANLRPICVTCNLSKGAKHPLDFLRSRSE